MTKREAVNEKQVRIGRSSPCPSQRSDSIVEKQAMSRISSPYSTRRAADNNRQVPNGRSSPYQLHSK
ncbi:hypothetical protein TNCT_645231 [Trichonephila clavata]|uniref:Uncharacterized protein n=1 Tax=Trichonephila clavata TaxID=2740835 RepID=A0A8X6M459_TRICU|nr:hypothetical protein TNCT_645231 [Trichonephila clavata]